jgi:hypothetical protein
MESSKVKSQEQILIESSNKDYVEELIELREGIEKNKSSIELLDSVLNKFKSQISKYCIEDFVASKIGKPLKELSAIENMNKETKKLIVEIMNLMKKAVKRINETDTKKSEVESKNKESNTSKQIDEEKFKDATYLKDYNERYKKTIETLKLKDNAMRSNIRVLLFDALLGEKKVTENLNFVKTMTDLVEKSIYDKLNSNDDKHAKYISRVKSIVFNLGVSLKIIF